MPTLNDLIDVPQLHCSLVRQLSPMFLHNLSHLFACPFLNLRIQSQLVKGKSHRGGGGLEACHEEQKHLGCHLTEGHLSQFSAVALEFARLHNLDQQRQEVVSLDVVLLPVLDSVAQHIKEEFCYLWRRYFNPQEATELWKQDGEHAFNYSSCGRFNDLLANATELAVRILQGIALHSKCDIANDIRGKLGQSLSKVNLLRVLTRDAFQVTCELIGHS